MSSLNVDDDLMFLVDSVKVNYKNYPYMSTEWDETIFYKICLLTEASVTIHIDGDFDDSDEEEFLKEISEFNDISSIGEAHTIHTLMENNLYITKSDGEFLKVGLKELTTSTTTNTGMWDETTIANRWNASYAGTSFVSNGLKRITLVLSGSASVYHNCATAMISKDGVVVAYRKAKRLTSDDSGKEDVNTNKFKEG